MKSSQSPEASSDRGGIPSITSATLQTDTDNGQSLEPTSQAHSDAPTPTPDQPKAKVVLLIVSVFMSVFLIALDRTIISTAIPAITDQFHSLTDVGWYNSAYTLTSVALQLLAGKIYMFYPIRIVLLSSVLLFEVGSVVCGAAPTSEVFIAGRAIAGMGSAGIMTGCIMVIVAVIPLEKRPRLQGGFGAIFGIASILGPLVGGALTTHVTWRWCFYINLPFGAVGMAVIATCLDVPEPETTKVPLMEKLKQLDGAGTLALTGSMVCLVLALQWGGQTYAWSSGRVIALFTLMGVFAIAFVAAQVFLPRTATIPGRVISQRSAFSGLWAITLIGGSMYILTYFLPIWFQVVKGVSAVDSGIRLLPFVLSMVVATVANGFFVQKIGYYTPTAIAGACLMTVGAGLLTTLQVDTGAGKWIGYQILTGFGLGMCFQAPNLAVQTTLAAKDVSIGVSLMMFGQLMGATIFVPVGTNVLNNQLISRLSGLPGFDPKSITVGGANAVFGDISPEYKAEALHDYNEAIRTVLYIGVGITAAVVLGIAGMEMKSVKKAAHKGPERGAAKDGEDEKATGQ